MRRPVPLAILLTLVLALSVHAQKLREAVTVEVVDVPVYVARGTTPVQGLTADDFELYVNGERQSIDYFDIVSPAAERTLRERRLFLLVFDAAFSRPHALVRAQQAAARLIASAPESDLFAIATFTSRGGIQFAVPFTADHAALQRAVARLTTSNSGDPLAIVMTETDRARMESFANNSSADAFLASMHMEDRVAADFLRESALYHLRRRARGQINTFQELSHRLASLEGQKHMVVMTEGFEGYTDNSIDIARSLPTPSGEWTLGAPFYDTYVYDAMLDMHEAFQHSDVLLHMIDLEGMREPQIGVASNLLAWGTGGTVTNGIDVTRSLRSLSDQFAYGYRLGFRPQSVRTGHNSIKVKLRNSKRGTTVHHRLGFSGTPQEANVDDGIYLADVVLNDVPQTGTAAALELRDGMLHATVPLQPLAAQLGEAGNAQLLIYAFDANGKAIAYHEQTITVPANAVGESTFDIPLPKEARVAKALLRVDESLGFTRVDS